MLLQRYKEVFLLVILSLIFFLYFISSLDEYSSFRIFFYDKASIKCYRYNLPSLADVTQAHIKSNSIFFHETSCNSYLQRKITINARQACAVESAAKMNPNTNIYLLFTAPGLIKNEHSESDDFLEALKSYSNVKIFHLNYELYTKNTPLEELYQKGTIEASDYAMSHASDILRYLTLWKYGGIYLDLDVIIIKSLENIPPNYAGRESNLNVAAGVIHFERNGTGHKLAEQCVDDLKHNFKGNNWGNNGPGVITRLSKKLCKVKDLRKLNSSKLKTCEGFNIYPPETFYPIAWQNWSKYMDKQSLKEVVRSTKNSYAIHVWNKHSGHMKLPVGSNVPYVIFARKYCPRVFSKCVEYF